ncbi:hypothetical protein [Clostridium botulinum]|uniref:hypothetical protein n=1 Tax=Clostridium botulinum TaxID=1491 RepID=UPI001F2E8D72|nr:hypothetical protein [Clostridium botulinum]
MEKSFVFNSVNGDRRYKAEDFREYFASFISNGVFPNPSNNLQVIANNDMTITIKAGKGWINGAIYINTDDYILNIDVADGVLNRIDKVVLRMDTAERKIYSYVKKGQFASSPTAPTLQRDADAYEIALADVAVNKGAISITQANITDLRLDKNLCGIVHGTVDQIDVTTLFNQYSTRFKIKSEEFEKEFEDWLKTLKDVLGEDTAGNLLNLITKNTESINNIKSDLADITTLTGNKDNLKTTNKTNLVSAINEVFTSGNNVKINTVDALLQLDKSLQITKESKWEDIIKNISKISTGKKWAQGTANVNYYGPEVGIFMESNYPLSSASVNTNCGFKPSIVILTTIGITPRKNPDDYFRSDDRYSEPRIELYIYNELLQVKITFKTKSGYSSDIAYDREYSIEKINSIGNTIYTSLHIMRYSVRVEKGTSTAERYMFDKVNWYAYE